MIYRYTTMPYFLHTIFTPQINYFRLLIVNGIMTAINHLLPHMLDSANMLIN